ncbi:MAG: response regulator [Nitrososphaerales archaeon]
MQSARRLLLVDDNTDILYAIKKGLESQNFIADAFSNPLEALASFEVGKYDFGLLDIQMPEMSGFELCRELTKRDPSLKFCFFTAYEVYREQFRNEFPEIKSDCFLKKPMSIARLVEEINKFLENNPASDLIEQAPFIKGPE